MTAVEQVMACLVCGSRDSATRLDGVTVRCPWCSFEWTADATPSSTDLYGAGYYAGGGYDDYFVPAARRYEAGRRIDWLLGHVRPATLLEVGCAGGFFVAAAVAAGIDARGVERSPVAAAYARTELGVRVEEAEFESVATGRTFAAVCAFHVLEHVDDPRRFIDAAWDALEPGGVLAVEVPNIASAAAARAGLDWHALQPEYHRWHFAPRAIARLVTQHGFEVVALDTVVLRSYLPPRYRRRQGRHLVRADARDLHTLRLRHPDRGELLRLIARRPAGRRGRTS